MLHLIKDLADDLINFLIDDPVRPEIPKDIRVGKNKDIFVSKESDNVTAITCVSYQHSIPEDVSDLFETCNEPDVAVFYTIWSYKPGAGRNLILESVKHIRETNTSIKRFVTLSPKTEVARKFHLRNGACVFRENTATINYEYLSV